MKSFVQRLTQTYRAVKLLTNPRISVLLERELMNYGEISKGYSDKPNANIKVQKQRFLGRNDAYFHKHYVVQVIG